MSEQAGKHFFARAQALYICVDPGHNEMMDGKVVRLGEKGVQFTPVGDGFGRAFVTDPDVIKHLEAREREVGDVFGPEQYGKLSIPAEKRVEMLERELTQKNSLIAKLQADGKLKK